MPNISSRACVLALLTASFASGVVAQQDMTDEIPAEIVLLYEANIDPITHETSVSEVERKLQAYELRDDRYDFQALYYALAIASDQTILNLCGKFASSSFYQAAAETLVEDCILSAYDAIRRKSDAGSLELSAYEKSVLSDEIFSLAPTDENLRPSDLSLLSDARAAALYERGERSDTSTKALVNSGNICDAKIMRDLMHDGVSDICFNFKSGTSSIGKDQFVMQQPIVKSAMEFCQKHSDAIPGERCIGEAMDAFSFFGKCVVPVHLLGTAVDENASDLTLKNGLDYCLENTVRK